MNRLLATALVITTTAVPALAQDIKEATRLHQQGKTAEAAKIWRQLALNGNAAAQFNLGQLFAAGIARPKRPDLAAFWFRTAGLQNHPGAQFRLGLLYANGNGVPKIRSDGIYWLRQAATKNHVNAQYNLALLLEQGNGPERQQARQWLQRAAKSGHAEAIKRLQSAKSNTASTGSSPNSQNKRIQIRGVKYIRALNPDYYTVVVTGFKSTQGLGSFVSTVKPQEPVAMYVSGTDKAPTLITGLFKERNRSKQWLTRLKNSVKADNLRFKTRAVKTVQRGLPK